MYKLHCLRLCGDPLSAGYAFIFFLYLMTAQFGEGCEGKVAVPQL